MLDRKIGPGYGWLNLRLYQDSDFAFFQELEDLGELRELSNFERDFDEAAGEEVNCFLCVETVADVGSLDGNHLDDSREYFGWSAGFRRETYADYGSASSAVLLFARGVN